MSATSTSIRIPPPVPYPPGRPHAMRAQRAPGKGGSATLWMLALGAFAAISLLALLLPDRPDTVLMLTVGLFVAIVVMHQPLIGTYIAAALTILFDTLPSPYVRIFTADLDIYRPLNARGLPDWFIFSIFELLVLLTLASVLVKRFTARRHMDRGPLLLPMLAFGGMILMGEFISVLTGGDFKITLWEIRPLLYLILLYVLAVNTMREPRHVRLLLWLVVIAVGLRYLDAMVRYYILMPPNVRASASTVLEHEDTLFVVVIFGLLAVAALVRRALSRRLFFALIVLAPFAALVMEINKRRAAYLCLMVLALTFVPILWSLFSRPEQRRRLAFILIASALILGTYTAAFWNSYGRLGGPAQLVRSLVEPNERDAASNLYRVQENANLNYTITSSPITMFAGVGFGKPMQIVSPMVDLTATWPLQLYMPHNNMLWIWMRMGMLGFVIFWAMIGAAILLIMACMRLALKGIKHLNSFLAVSRGAIRVATLHVSGEGKGSYRRRSFNRAFSPGEVRLIATRQEWAEFLLLAFLALATVVSLLGVGVVDQGLMSDRLMAFTGLVMGTLAAGWRTYSARLKEFNLDSVTEKEPEVLSDVKDVPGDRSDMSAGDGEPVEVLSDKTDEGGRLNTTPDLPQAPPMTSRPARAASSNRPDRTQLKIELCEDISGLHALRAEWNDLVHRSENSSVFSSWEWTEAFWSLGAPERQTMALVARDCEGKLVGLLPLSRAAGLGLLPRLEAAGCTARGYPLGDYGGLVAELGRAPEVWVAMLQTLKKQRWWIVDLRNCAVLSEGTQAGLEACPLDVMAQQYKRLPVRRWRVRVARGEMCRRVRLPASWDQYLAGLSVNSRQNIKRKLRKLHEAGYSIEQVDPMNGPARTTAMKALFDLHQAHWTAQGESGSFFNEAQAMHLRLARNLSSLGALDLRVVRSPSGEIGGVIYNFRWRGVTYFYQMGLRQDEPWTRYSLGICLLANSLQAAIGEGHHTFDLLRGDHEYKRHFGGYTVNNLRVTIYRFDWLPRLEKAARRSLFVRRVLPAALCLLTRRALV